MKGLVVDEKGTLSFQTLEIPKINEYQALVQMVSCGICNGTDGKLIHHKMKDFDTYPAVLGHEAVGRVVSVGKKVTTYQVGDIVLLPFLEEKNNGFFSGWGGYAEYGVIGDAVALKKDGYGEGSPLYSESYEAQSIVPPSVDPVKAAMIVTFREVLSAIFRFQWQPNEAVLVFGAGPVGLSFIRFCKLLGIGPILCVEIDDSKLAEAKKMGADFVFNSKKVSLEEAIRAQFPDGVPNIVDAVGLTALIQLGLRLVSYGGKICCYGISPETTMTLDWTKAPYNWSLLFQQWPSKKEEGDAHRQIIAWLETGALCLDDFIYEIVPFEQSIEAFQRILSGKTSKKVIVKYDTTLKSTIKNKIVQ